MKWYLRIGSFLLWAFACSQSKHQEAAVFVKPVILHTMDSLHYFRKNFLWPHNPFYAGKYTCMDTLRTYRSIYDSSYAHDLLEAPPSNNTMPVRGFEIIPDYTQTICWGRNNAAYNTFYPLYVVNPSHTNMYFTGKDACVFAIQEAMDTAGHWRPISAYNRASDFCGNGSWTLRVHPNEFILILLPKYTGTYSTKLRVRVANNGIIYTSQPFEGMIEKAQFYLDKENWLYHECLEDPDNAVSKWFYGSEPLEIEAIRAQHNPTKVPSSKK